MCKSQRLRLSVFVREIESLIKKTGITILYLATDDALAKTKIETHLPGVTIVQYTVPQANVSNLHYGCADKYRQVYECLRDVFFLTMSDMFVPSMNSGLSKLVLEMRKSKFSLFE